MTSAIRKTHGLPSPRRSPSRRRRSRRPLLPAAAAEAGRAAAGRGDRVDGQQEAGQDRDPEAGEEAEGDAVAHRCDYPPLARRPEHRTETRPPERTADPAPPRTAPADAGARAPAADRQPRGRRDARARPEAEDPGQAAGEEGAGAAQGRHLGDRAGRRDDPAELGAARREPTDDQLRRGGAPRARPPAPAVQEVVVTTDLGDHSDKIMREALVGQPWTWRSGSSRAGRPT